MAIESTSPLCSWPSGPENKLVVALKEPALVNGSGKGTCDDCIHEAHFNATYPLHFRAGRPGQKAKDLVPAAVVVAVPFFAPQWRQHTRR